MNFRSLLVASGCLIATASAIAQDAVPVTTKTFADVAVFPQREVAAETLSLNSAQLSAEVEATIKAIPVNVGDHVSRGEVLARLDDADFMLAVARAEATLRASEANLTLADYQYQRAQTLAKQSAISEELLKEREAAFHALQAQLDSQRTLLQQAQRDADRTVLRAPFEALVTARTASVGERATPTKPILTLVDIQNLEVSAQLTPADAATLPNATALRFTTDGQVYELVIRSVVGNIDPTQRSQEVRLRFAGKAALPGAVGNLHWTSAAPHLPPELVVRRHGQLGVFIAEGERARFQPLPDAREGQIAAADLAADTAIVIDGRFRLQDGDMLSRP